MARQDARTRLGAVMNGLYTNVVDNHGLAESFLHSIGNGPVDIAAVTAAGITLDEVVKNVDVVNNASKALERLDLTDQHALHMQHTELYNAIARSYHLA